LSDSRMLDHPPMYGQTMSRMAPHGKRMLKVGAGRSL
jgi:hypothetical protein